MKVVLGSEMVKAEKLAYAAGAVDRDFMARAGEGIARAIQRLTSDWSIAWNAILLCGRGNNAGDGYVAGCHMLQMGYKVKALQLSPIEQCTPLCQENHRRFIESGGAVSFIDHIDEIELPESGFIVDAILGTGFHGRVEGLFAQVIELANRSRLPIFALDIPSGVSGDSGVGEGPAIEAVATLYLALPKKGFFLGRAWECVGHLVGVDFGIEERFLDEAPAEFEMAIEREICHLLPRVARTRDKYSAGAITALAGSASMPGAAILASFSALRAGAGLVRLLFPKEAEISFSAAPPELIRCPFEKGEGLIDHFHRSRAALIGPGIGLGQEVAEWVGPLLDQIICPVVLDADLLTLIAAHPEWKLPPQAVLTPHMGEFCRLIGRERESVGSSERIDLARAYAERIQRTVVLKGAPTFIFHPGCTPVVSPPGDPAMATAGAGDVLTGVIAALLAQGLSTWDAARLGVFLHGRAGQMAAQKRTLYGVVASDLIEELASSFRALAAAITLGIGVVTPTPGFANIGLAS